MNRDAWEMRCLLCNPPTKWYDLVAIQEHGMREHGFDQKDLMNATRKVIAEGLAYYWTLPDGRKWLDAVKWPR